MHRMSLSYLDFLCVATRCLTCVIYINVISFSVSIVSSLLYSSPRTCSLRGVQIVPTSCIRDNSSSWKRSNWVMIWSDHKAQIWRRSQFSSPVLPLNMCLYPHPGFFCHNYYVHNLPSSLLPKKGLVRWSTTRNTSTAADATVAAYNGSKTMMILLKKEEINSHEKMKLILTH